MRERDEALADRIGRRVVLEYFRALNDGKVEG
jgi:hypothetical protein